MSCIALAFLLNFANELCTDNNAVLQSVGFSNTHDTLVVVCQNPNGGELIINNRNFFENKKRCVSDKEGK